MTTITLANYEALSRQAGALQIIFESLPVGVMVADADGRILFSNPAAERILRLAATMHEPGPATVTGWYLPDQITLLAPEKLPLARTVRGEKVSDELLFVRGVQLGKRLEENGGAWIRVNGWPLRDADGLVYGGVVMFHDFTEGREAL